MLMNKKLLFHRVFSEMICNQLEVVNNQNGSGPMRRISDEPRQVRKEAAVVMRLVCCGVPDPLLFLSLACRLIKLQ